MSQHRSLPPLPNLHLSDQAYKGLNDHVAQLHQLHLALLSDATMVEQRIALIETLLADARVQTPAHTRVHIQTPNERAIEQLEQLRREERARRIEGARRAVQTEGHKNKRRRKPQNGRAISVEDETMLALEAAGASGLTGRQLASLTDLPIGTASARLSIMKKDGLIGHRQPHYFLLEHIPATPTPTPTPTPTQHTQPSAVAGSMVVHSTQEDNNQSTHTPVHQ